MTTTLILAGGNDSTTDGYGQRLSYEIAKYVDHPNILSCFFSWPAETWEAKSHDWGTWFSEFFGVDVRYDYAKADTFLSQIDSADVIYLHGGDTQLLFDTLPPAAELKEHFCGKIVVGSSAGANALSSKYWSSKRAVAARGLGLTNLNVMAHYGAPVMGDRSRTEDDWAKEAADFQGLIGIEKITRLPEGQLVVRQV